MSNLIIEKHEAERVAVVTMNYKNENRFHPDFMAELMAALDEFETDDTVGALVFTGAHEKFFSNGLDLEYLMMNFSKPDTVVKYLETVNGLFKRTCLFPKPMIAALNGHTFAAGFFLSAHMDFRFMREDRGWCCLPEVDINIPLLPGMIAVCQAVMPPQSFRQFYYTGRRVTGPEAKEMGFVDEVFSAEDLLPKSIEFAAGMAKKKTRTFAEMKRRIRQPVADILDNEDPPLFMETFKFSMPGS